MRPDGDYQYYKKIFKHQRMPLAFVDLDRFDRNITYVASTQKNTEKTIRVHSKSLRCVKLTQRIFEKGGPAYKGIMDFSMEETQYLADKGFDNFIVAYPTVQPSDLKLFAELTQKGIKVSQMVDCEEHLKLI